jgi:hypothetical protein
MLLPSPLPSEPFLPPTQITRPTLKSMGAYQSQSHSATNTLLASCRTLQSILSTSLSCQIKPSQIPTSRQKRTETRHPLQPSIQRHLKKRCHDVYSSDSDDILSIPSPNLDRENYNPNPAYSTPKRRRRIPLSMPLGLCAADFHSLHATPDVVQVQVQVQVHLDMPNSDPSAEQQPSIQLSPSTSWTAADDSALVSTVLEKLQLSRHEWNDCARILGKDEDSLGRRWRMLVGDGEVGLRRGRGRRERLGLDLGSW